MIRVIALAAFLAVGPGLAAADGGTTLKRLTLRQDTLGWEGVGRLDLDGGFCTGALIAPNLVLTAAHCLLHSEGRQDPGRIRFRAGLRDGEAVAERGARRVVAHSGFSPERGMDADNVRHDVALVELDSPIPAAVARPYLTDLPGPAGAEVTLVSFAAGREEALSRQPVCSVLGADNGLLAFDCSVDFGASGAPVFDRSISPARIVSVISGGATTEGGVIAYGMALPGLVADLKHALRTGRGVWPEATGPGPVVRLGADHRGAGHFVKP